MKNGDKINIVLVDDHAIVVDGVEALLATIPRIYIAGKAANGHAALHIMEAVPADLVITDYSMEGMDCLTLINTLKKDYPLVKIIVMSMHDEPSIVQSVLRAGADGYILKKYTHHELLTAIEIITEGGQFWSQEINKILLKKLQPEDTVQITDREMEVLKLLNNELNSRQIAAQLFISERTVDTHRKNLLRKTSSTNIVGLLKYAQAHKLL